MLLRRCPSRRCGRLTRTNLTGAPTHPVSWELVKASTFAELGGGYQRFGKHAGDGLLLKLNEEFTPLKAYTTMRAKKAR